MSYEINEQLLEAFSEKDILVIVEELKPLIYKNMNKADYNIQEDLYQELILSIIKVINNFDYERNGDLEEYLEKLEK